MIKNKGFTLIELLVVISIIGILAVFILTNLGTASEKGANAGIKSNINQIKNQAGVHWAGNNQSYFNFCNVANIQDTAQVLQRTFTQIQETAKTSGTPIIGGVSNQTFDASTGTASIYCNSNTRFYVISAPLRASEIIDNVKMNFWCADSTGFVGGIQFGLHASDTKCSQASSSIL